MCAYSWVSGLAARRSRSPTSSGSRLALRQLHFLQATTWFSQVLGAPPLDTGTTWSMVSSEAGPTKPQYWQEWSSRSSRLRRLGRSIRRGTWMVRSRRTMTTPSGRRRPARALMASTSASSVRKATRCLLRSTTRRRRLITFSGCIEALSSRTAMLGIVGCNGLDLSVAPARMCESARAEPSVGNRGEQPGHDQRQDAGDSDGEADVVVGEPLPAAEGALAHRLDVPHQPPHAQAAEQHRDRHGDAAAEEG